ncbi:hypothetical protein GGI12_004424, partial [Dipsacomyces acuminosporus]
KKKEQRNSNANTNNANANANNANANNANTNTDTNSKMRQQQQNELDLIETGGVYNNGLTGRPQYTFYMDENTQRPQMVAIHQLPPQHQQRRQSIDEENLPRYTPPEPSSSQNKDDTPPSYAEVTAPPRAQVPPSS